MAYPRPSRIKEPSELLANNNQYDAVIIVSPKAEFAALAVIDKALKQAQEVDQRLSNQHVLIHCAEVCGGRLIHAVTGALDKDYDDVRNFGDAAKAAVIMAKDAGAVNPAIIVDSVPATNDYQFALESAYLGACQGLWQPLEARQALGENEVETVQSVGLYDPQSKIDLDYLSAVEAGRRLARDLCGTEPERMAPIGFANYCIENLVNTDVQVKVISDQQQIDS